MLNYACWSFFAHWPFIPVDHSLVVFVSPFSLMWTTVLLIWNTVIKIEGRRHFLAGQYWWTPNTRTRKFNFHAAGYRTGGLWVSSAKKSQSTPHLHIPYTTLPYACNALAQPITHNIYVHRNYHPMYLCTSRITLDQHFLGSLNYYSRFIEDIAIYTSFLYEWKNGLISSRLGVLRNMEHDCSAEHDHACSIQIDDDRGQLTTGDYYYQLLPVNGHNNR